MNYSDLEYGWIPQELIGNLNSVISQLTANQSTEILIELLWDKRTTVFIYSSEELKELAAVVAHPLSSIEEKRSSAVLLLSLLTSIEVLAENFCAWGESFAEAQEKAITLLTQHFPENRSRLLDYFMPKRSQMPFDLKSQFGPK